MSTLHLVRSPDRALLERCLARIGNGDRLLLAENGVYQARESHAPVNDLLNLAQRQALYVLSPDLQARGLTDIDLIPKVQPVDYSGFVDLTIAASHTVTW